MITGRNTATLYLTITGGVILIGLIVFAPWPRWISLLAAAGLGTALLYVTGPAKRLPTRTSPPDPAPGLVPRPMSDVRRTHLPDTLLPTNLPDYFFLFSATVIWSPTSAITDESATNHAAVAIDAVVKRAREITELRDPGHASLVRHELASALAEMQTDGTGRVRAMAESVQLALPGHDQERLDKLAAARKEEAIWEHKRKFELNKREYLSRDVLKNLGSTVVWRLARNDDQVEKTVKEIDLLAQLSSAANNTDPSETFHSFIPESPNGSEEAWPPGHTDSTADLFESLLQTLQADESDPQRRLSARQMAEELIRRYDPPTYAEPAEDADDGIRAEPDD